MTQSSILPKNLYSNSVLTWKSGGGDVRNFEPVIRPNFTKLNKSIQKLRKIYRDKPEWFEIPDFAQKVY